MGRRSERAFGGFSLGIGTISEILNASGNMPEIRAQLMILQKGKASSATMISWSIFVTSNKYNVLI